MAEDKQRDPNAPGDPFERITPTALTPGGKPREDARSPHGKTLPLLAVLTGLVLVALLGGGLLWWLAQPPDTPDVAAAPGDDKPAPPAEAGAPQPAAPPESAPDADELLAQRERAQALADSLTEKRERLAGQAVQRWAAPAAAAIAKDAETGDKRFASRDYAGAAEAYEQAIASADAQLARAGEQLEQALQRGQAALDKDNAKAAAEAFDLALAIDGDNAKAAKGAERAADREAVLAQMRAGRQSEADGELDAARAAFQKARDLDADYEPANSALTRVDAAIAARAFQRRMSEGLAALDQGAFAAARTAFIAARKLRPDAAEARDGLARAQAGAERAAIDSQRRRAQAAEAEEDWPTAVSAYEAILARDDSLAFAREGAARAAKRADLAQRLRYHLDNLGRLSTAAVRADVAAVLETARAVSDPGPKLDARVQRLSAALERASHPVAVRLQSDNQAEVLVYHVGRLGRFESKRLELTPGEYTAIGRCAGHRDARRQFTVSAGGQTGPVTIVCGEKL